MSNMHGHGKNCMGWEERDGGIVRIVREFIDYSARKRV